jgi:hypothetical protein
MVKLKSVLLLLLILFFSTSAFAGDIKKSEILDKYETVENNLLVGVESDNYGLRTSCAYFLGSIQSERALIPLLRMLKEGGTEEERILAALSLCKINSERGLFAVKRAIKFDDSERVQRMCKSFYCAQRLKQLKGDVTVEPIELANLILNEEYKGMKLVDFAK